jgi:diguanylate cyclase (GGDEF)-like protein/PAS domain S-box-containing protein
MVKSALSIRIYLLLLVLAVMLPFLGLYLYVVSQQTARETRIAQDMVVSLAHIAAGDTEHFLGDARLVLQRLVEQPAIRSLDAQQCTTYLSLFPCVNPNFCSISVVTATGAQVCSVAAAASRPIDVLRAPDWLHNTLADDGMTISGPFVDADGDRHLVVLSHPIRDVAGAVSGAVAITVDLLNYDSVHYKTALENAQLPAGSVVTIIGANGVVIARWPNAAKWVGTRSGDVPIVRRVINNSAVQGMRAQGMDGVEKVYGIAAIRGTNWHLYAGIPVAVILTPVQQALFHNLMLGAAIAALAAALAFYMGGRIRNPIRLLSRAARAAALGRMDVRVPQRGPKEVIEMGARFNEMLAARASAEQALAEEKERAEVTLASIGDAVITTDEQGKVNYLNPVAEQLTGWTALQANGLPLFNVLKLQNSVTGEPIERSLGQAIETGYLVSVADNTVLVNRHGQEFAVADCAAPIRDSQARLIGMVLVFRDISKARDLSNKLSWQASHDALTGLFNRVEFEVQLSQAMDTAKQDSLKHALLYLDLDQFKIVNDTCGHVAGDELLRHLAVLLMEQVRDADTLARLGGDEFGVLLENCPLEQALRIAEQFRETIQDFRFAWQGKTFSIGVSIGLVPIDDKSESLAQVLSSADAACYAAKEKGRNRVHVFQPDNLELAQHLGEMQWVQRISDAFEEDRFLLYTQAIMPLDEQSNKPHYQEILIRLRDEKGDVLSPGAFLPAAERYNLMPTVDRWVLRTLFAQLGEHRDGLDKREIYCVNIAGPTLSDEHFLDFVIDQLAGLPLPPERICFEITESAAIHNLPQATRFITVLKNMGCRFALDDFGSGLSSFAYLKNLAVDHLKIDGSFVRDMHTDILDYAMVESINNIGHVMNLTTIGEWAENEETVEKLRQLGVDYVQGYAISRPTPLKEHLAGL